MDTVEEGKQNVEGAEGKSHPETVPWNQYVGVKEMLTKTETEAAVKVQHLEEQIKSAVSTDEFQKIKKELEDSQTNLTKVSEELKVSKEKSLTEKRDILKERGIPEEKLNAMSEEALTAVVGVLEQVKQPRPDLGGGGGKTEPTGSPIELARQAYSK